VTAPIDLAGQTFGRLTVLERRGSTPGRAALWLARCICGSEVVVVGRHMRTGNTQSCGCLFRETVGARAAERNAKETVGYNGAHKRVRRLRGEPAGHDCVDCSKPAAEWSYARTDPRQLVDAKGRLFSLDPDHYVPRCIPCHRRHDAAQAAS
jgi:hypothetical protein